MKLEEIKVSELPELKGWEQKMKDTVKENPFVEITDNETYGLAKKARTALKTARTDVQKQDKLLATKIKEFRSKVSGVAQKLVDITKPHEDKQQKEITKYENAKAEEKRQKQEAERLRVSAINDNIQDFKKESSEYIQKMTLESEVPVWTEIITTYDAGIYEEFQPMYDEAREEAVTRYDYRLKELQEKKKLEVQNERLKKLQPYTIFIRDLDAVLRKSDDDFEKEIKSLEEQKRQHDEAEAQKNEEARIAQEKLEQAQVEKEELQKKADQAEAEKVLAQIEVTVEKRKKIIEDGFKGAVYDDERQGYDLKYVFIPLENLQDLKDDDFQTVLQKAEYEITQGKEREELERQEEERQRKEDAKRQKELAPQKKAFIKFVNSKTWAEKEIKFSSPELQELLAEYMAADTALLQEYCEKAEKL